MPCKPIHISSPKYDLLSSWPGLCKGMKQPTVSDLCEGRQSQVSCVLLVSSPWLADTWSTPQTADDMSVNGMVHLTTNSGTMLAPIASMDPAEYKNTTKTLDFPPLFFVMATFRTLKISVRSQKKTLLSPQKIGEKFRFALFFSFLWHLWNCFCWD